MKSFKFLSDRENQWLKDQRLFFPPKWGFFRFFSAKQFAFSWMHFLDCIEYQPVKFEYKREEEAKEALTFYKIINQISTKILREPLNEALKRQLQRRVIAFQYRIESVNSGVDKIEFEESSLLNDLLTKARQWRISQGKNPHHFEKKERNFLVEAGHYPLFLELLEHDAELRHEFFCWTLMSHNHPASLIEYPAIISRIQKAYYLASHIGTVGSHLLKIQKLEAGENAPALLEKALTMLFAGKYISLLGEDQIIDLGVGYHLTIKQFFEDFRNKQYETSCLEIFAAGVLNWSSKEMGYWDEEKKGIQPISLEEQHWWEELPLLGIKTKEEIEEKYHLTESGLTLKDQEWIVAPHAMTDPIGGSMRRLHAYIIVVIPIKKGWYVEYPFGKTTKINPRQLKDFQLLGGHFAGALTYPDEFYFHREKHHSRIAYIISPGKGQQFMDYIAEYIAIVRQGQSNYQYVIENCAGWAQGLLDKVFGRENIHNLFAITFEELEFDGSIGMILKALKRLPKSIRIGLFSLWSILIGGWKSKRWLGIGGQEKKKSLLKHGPWRFGNYVHHPALLRLKQKRGDIPYAMRLSDTFLEIKREDFE